MVPPAGHGQRPPTMSEAHLRFSSCLSGVLRQPHLCLLFDGRQELDSALPPNDEMNRPCGAARPRLLVATVLPSRRVCSKSGGAPVNRSGDLPRQESAGIYVF